VVSAQVCCVCDAVDVQDLDIIHSELRAKDIERLEGELHIQCMGGQGSLAAAAAAALYKACTATHHT